MEDLLELFALAVIVIIGSVVKSNKKNKEKAQKAEASSSKPIAPVSDRNMTSRSNIENAVKAFSELAEAMDKGKTAPAPTVQKPVPAQKKPEQTSIEAETASKQRAEMIQKRILESLLGHSATDEHGCIGGSMPEHEPEGETPAEHSAHEHNRAERLQAESKANHTKSPHKPTVAELRKAVVMSEILDKPVSLRRRSI